VTQMATLISDEEMVDVSNDGPVARRNLSVGGGMPLDDRIG
jgi:hypothetical protein